MKLKINMKPMRIRIRLGGGRTMPEVLSIYRGDVEPALDVWIYDYNPDTLVETPADLSAPGTVVRLKTTPRDGGAVVTNAILLPVNALKGQFRHVWQPTDTAVAQVFIAEISLETPGQTIPITPRVRTIRQFQLHVLEDIPS